jgi:hypothetical protein
VTRADGRSGRALALPGGRGGFALNAVLVLIVLATLIVSTSVVLTVAEEQSVGAAARRARLAAVADGVLAEMQERLLSRAQEVSGALWDSDLALMNSTAVLELQEPPDGIRIDFARTGWRVTEVRTMEVLPHDEVPIAAWTDQPRLSYAELPPVGGLVAARTLVVAVFATVRDGDGGWFRVRRDLAISQVPPHQHALYSAGDAELCASGSSAGWIGGPVRVDGTLLALSCPSILRYSGGIEARDGIAVTEPSTHYVVGTDGQLSLASVSRAAAEADAAGSLAPWGGRVRVSSALGGEIGTGRLSSASIAGSGECDDVPAAGALGCGGNARYYPSVQVQRTGSGAGTGYALICGPSYDEGCSDVAAAITYTPWPFAAAQPAGGAAADPASPGLPWKGLLPDARRESRCTASVGGNTFRTARCPSNVYGYRIDVGALPALAGGVLSIRRATGQAPGANPSGAQEVVLLTNATSLAAPLTIHSEIPVYIAGNFNTAFRAAYNGPPPAKIHAPRVVVLPNEALAQLQTSAVWDSVPRAGSTTASAMPLRAESNVTVYAVIRSGFCRTVGGEYFGGAWEGIPAVLGDWSGAGLRVVGAVEANDETTTAAACARYAAAFGADPSGTPTRQPASRTLLFDDRLLHPGFQPPGAWGNGNVVYTGPSAIPSRPYSRQLRAIGGTVVVRRVRDEQRGFPAIPAAVSIPGQGPYPAAPLPLP